MDSPICGSSKEIGLRKLIRKHAACAGAGGGLHLTWETCQGTKHPDHRNITGVLWSQHAGLFDVFSLHSTQQMEIMTELDSFWMFYNHLNELC